MIASSKGFRLSRISFAASSAISFHCSFRSLSVALRCFSGSLTPEYLLYTTACPLYSSCFPARVQGKAYSVRGPLSNQLSPTVVNSLLHFLRIPAVDTTVGHQTRCKICASVFSTFKVARTRDIQKSIFNFSLLIATRGFNPITHFHNVHR